MSVVVVTVTTQPGVTATSTSPGDASSTLPAQTVAGIVIGTLLGGSLFIVLVLYLLNRYRRHKFTRVANPAHDRVSAVEGGPDLGYLPSPSPRKPKYFTRHSQRPSISTEPLMSPVLWPPLPSVSRLQSSGTPPRIDSLSPGIRDSQFGSFDPGEISHVITSGSVSHSATPAILNIPPARKPQSESLQSGSGDTTPRAWRTSGGGSSPSTSPKPQQNLFLHRMLQSRARASEGVSPSCRPSLDFSQSRSTTLESSSIRVDVERLLAEAERTALRDAEKAEKVMFEQEDDWGEVDSTESIYSQLSAPIDHSMFFSESASRRDSSSPLPRRKSSRRSRTPAPPTELPPVAEVPDTPRALEGQTSSRPVSTAANSSLDGQVSHGTASRPMSSAVDLSGPLPLLTSTKFGKDSTTSSTPPGSILSTVGWGSSSSGGTSRYPSLALSSVGQSSRSGPRSDDSTDWHHPPSGLAGLTSLQIGTLRNPHSPVEEQPESPEVLFVPRPAEPAPAERAHLREGTACSMPEVERRTVMQSGIAHIDVAL